jgi:hypothetical protein
MCDRFKRWYCLHFGHDVSQVEEIMFVLKAGGAMYTTTLPTMRCKRCGAVAQWAEGKVVWQEAK